MRDCLLLTHQFIRYNDPKENWKPEVFMLCVKFYREWNRDALIILTGHGKKFWQGSEIEKYVDFVYWEEDIIESEIGRGHPKLVNKGLKIAEKAGIENVCKVRLDSTIMIRDICKHCKEKSKVSGKRLINSDYYENSYLLWDLFMYGSTQDLLVLFDNESWSVPWDKSGMGPLAKNYIEKINNSKIVIPFDKNFWIKEVNKNNHFISPIDLKWIDARKHHSFFLRNPEIIMSGRLKDFKKYTFFYGKNTRGKIF